MESIICEECGYEQDYDPDNDVTICDFCGSLIFIPPLIEDSEDSPLDMGREMVILCL